jgi:chaperonin cofactor prefoldin
MDELLEEIEELEATLEANKKELEKKISAINERINKNNTTQNVKNKNTAETLATQKQALEAQSNRVDSVLVQLETIKASVNAKMDTNDIIRLL